MAASVAERQRKFRERQKARRAEEEAQKAEHLPRPSNLKQLTDLLAAIGAGEIEASSGQVQALKELRETWLKTRPPDEDPVRKGIAADLRDWSERSATPGVRKVLGDGDSKEADDGAGTPAPAVPAGSSPAVAVPQVAEGEGEQPAPPPAAGGETPPPAVDSRQGPRRPREWHRHGNAPTLRDRKV